MQALREVPHDPAILLLETKQCEAEQTRAALRAIKPIRTQLKAAIESRDKLMKKHAVVADGVQSSVAQLHAKQAGMAELANALRAGGAVARKSTGRRACRGALHSHWQRPRRHVCSAVGGRVLQRWQVLRQRHS